MTGIVSNKQRAGSRSLVFHFQSSKNLALLLFSLWPKKNHLIFVAQIPLLQNLGIKFRLEHRTPLPPLASLSSSHGLQGKSQDWCLTTLDDLVPAFFLVSYSATVKQIFSVLLCQMVACVFSVLSLESLPSPWESCQILSLPWTCHFREDFLAAIGKLLNNLPAFLVSPLTLATFCC